jgi:serine protease Do
MGNAKRVGWAVVLLMGISAAAPAADPPDINLRRTVTVEVVEKTKDAVVTITATEQVQRNASPFGRAGGRGGGIGGQVLRADALGSGIIVHPDGYVVTNNHVVAEARKIVVELADGRKFPADVVNTDPSADLAVLRIHSDKPLPAIDLGDSSDLMIGEPVIAVGNPMGFEHSVSTGIVSAVHRDLTDDNDAVVLGDLVQTDAAINPGNSGGPLLNAYGQVIAINCAIRSDAQNIGFAIPIDKLRDLIPTLMDPLTAAKLDLPIHPREQRTITEPATITSKIVTAGGRAIASIDGKVPHDIVDVYAILLQAKAGDELKVAYADGKTETLAAKDAAPPDSVVQAKSRLGLEIVALTPILAETNHLNQETGLLVTSVVANGPADLAGVQKGDIVIQIGRSQVASLNDLSGAITRLPTKGTVRVTLIRNNRVNYGNMVLGGS